MMYQAWACCLALLLPTNVSAVLHEKRSSNSAAIRWREAALNTVVPFRIALKPSNLKNAYAALLNNSDPASPNYGRHWSADQVDDFFAPTDYTVDNVRDWLISAGVGSEAIAQTRDKAYLSLDLTIAEAGRLLSAKFHEYVSKDSIRLGCDEYHLPDHVSQHVEYIVPGVVLSPPLNHQVLTQKKLSRRSLEASLSPPQGNTSAEPSLNEACCEGITPDCIRALYSIPRACRNDSVNVLGMFEAGSYFDQSDLDSFFTNHSPNIPNGTHPDVRLIANASEPVHPALSSRTEATLDLDVAYSLIYPQSITLYQVGRTFAGRNLTGFGPFVQSTANFLYALDGIYCTPELRALGTDCGTASPPTRVISMSWDQTELDSPLSFQRRQCHEIMKLALQGTTTVISSGDFGVGSQAGIGGPGLNTNGCIVQLTHNISTTQNGTIFTSNYPNNCPYVLSVGATELVPSPNPHDPPTEQAMLIPHLAAIKGGTYSSSGGFSNYFPRPLYQNTSIATYLKHHNPGYPSYASNFVDASNPTTTIGKNGGLYAHNGRGIPDVSALGRDFLVTLGNDTNSKVNGTSLAAPIWASMITLINEERTAVGKGPVGFVNPVLYAHPEIFHDVTKGRNPGCGTQGFEAVEGWDPATGLGTPDYGKMLEVFMSLP